MTSETIGAVDPVGVAGEAATLLSAAWPKPALRYTVEYLRWQLTFPGHGRIQPVAVAAHGSQGMIGFAAATPRRVQWAGRVEWVQLVSFVAVDASSQGRGLGGRLYDNLLGRITPQGPFGVLTFAQDQSAGLHTLEKAYARAGYTPNDLGGFDALGGVVRPSDQPAPALRMPEGAPAVEAGSDLINAPDQLAFEHYFRDPRKPSWVDFGLDGHGHHRGAIVVTAERATVRGAEPFQCVTNLFGAPFSLPELTTLVAEAGRMAPIGARSLTVPNPRRLPPEHLRSVGLRTIPGRYRGVLFQASGTPLPVAGSHPTTTVELV